MTLLNPHYFESGAIAVGPRLKTKALSDVKTQGVTHIVTLLSEKEGALDIQKAVVANDLGWCWLSLENAKPPEVSRKKEILALFETLEGILNEGGYLYFHCAAGIHRTGMITYAFLRYLDMNAAEAFETLKQLRELSSQEVGAERLQWGNSLAAVVPSELPQAGKVSLDQFLQHTFIDCVCYAHSVGEGYQYRGRVAQIYPNGGMRLTNVETASKYECDFDFTNPYTINGDWQEYEDFDYSSEGISIEATTKGLIISYAHAGTVYLHYS